MIENRFAAVLSAAHIAVLVMILAGGCSESESSESAAEAVDASGSAASDAAAVSTDTRPNAAAEYERIYTTSMGTGFFDTLSNQGADNPPGPSESAFLQSKQDLIQQIIAASTIERCEFTLDLSQGIDLLVPHLGWMRGFCKLLQYDAHRFIMAPSGEKGAVERLAAILRIANHQGNDQIILSKLVGVACTNLAVDSISRWNSRIVDPANRAALREQLQKVRSGHLFDIKSALRQELALARTSIKSGKPFGMMEGTAQALSEAERNQVMQQVEQAYSELETAWDTPDAKKRIDAIIARIKSTKAMLFIGALDKFYEQVKKSQSKLDAAIQMLK